MTQLAAKRPTGRLTVLAVRLGQSLFAIPIAAVEEVLPALPVEAVPQCPRFVRGVVFVRGHLIPVLDAAERLGLVEHQRSDDPHIVCLRHEDRLVGVEFDEALDLLEIGADELLAADQLGAAAGFLRGLIEHDGLVVRLLDPEALIANDEAVSLRQLPTTRAREEMAEPHVAKEP
ncbi:MAG: chemotaxis protein CheW [Pirellulales bacterium]